MIAGLHRRVIEHVTGSSFGSPIHERVNPFTNEGCEGMHRQAQVIFGIEHRDRHDLPFGSANEGVGLKTLLLGKLGANLAGSSVILRTAIFVEMPDVDVRKHHHSRYIRQPVGMIVGLCVNVGGLPTT
jgi:hypothetical protein